MASFMKIDVVSKHTATWRERKVYLSSLFDVFERHQMGFFSKFNNALGFKDVVCDYVTKYPVILEKKVETPDDYIAPIDLFVKKLPCIPMKGNTLFTLYVEEGVEKHPISRYSYDHFEMGKRFCKFMQKVFPDLEITYSIVNKYPPDLEHRIFNYFFLCMELEDNYCTVECSMPRLLSDVELKRVETQLKKLYVYGFHLEQYYCETCAGYHPKSPYHIEVVYEK